MPLSDFQSANEDWLSIGRNETYWLQDHEYGRAVNLTTNIWRILFLDKETFFYNPVFVRPEVEGTGLTLSCNHFSFFMLQISPIAAKEEGRIET